MIDTILFDLDGVLIDAKQIHYEALNKALGKEYSINKDEHTNIYDGKKTWEKLDMLTKNKGLPQSRHSKIHEQKQKITIEMVNKLEPITNVFETLRDLKNEGYNIGVCSNSVRMTVVESLRRSKLSSFVDYIVSNEDVTTSKPYPEMYWKAMIHFKKLPQEVLIVEDSPTGLLAAVRSGANVLRVENPYTLTHERVKRKMTGTIQKNQSTWESEDLNILIPMAGAGSRFSEVGYTFPKPLIEVLGKPMIQLVVENLGLKGNYIYVVQKEHREKYNLDTLLNIITPNCKIVEVDGITEGAACTALLAKEHIDNNKPLFFANSDQYVNWNPSEFMYFMQETDSDGGIVYFSSHHPKWSYVKTDRNGVAELVAEKKPISNKATVGFYYYKKGSDFVKYAESMIEKNTRTNGEFYVCPVYNEAIRDGKKIRVFEAERMRGLGTPEDLQEFIRGFENESYN